MTHPWSGSKLIVCQTERKMCSPSGEVRGAKDRGEAGGSRRKVKGFSQNKTKAHKGGRQCTNSNTRTHTHTQVWHFNPLQLKRHGRLTLFKHLFSPSVPFLFLRWLQLLTSSVSPLLFSIRWLTCSCYPQADGWTNASYSGFMETLLEGIKC